MRRARLEIEKECEEDFARIYARAVEVQKKAPAKLVSRPGTDKITTREIDREITAYRNEKGLETPLTKIYVLRPRLSWWLKGKTVVAG